MRGMFGLVALLVTLGVVLMIFKMVEAPTLERGKQTHDEAQQMSGRGQDGRAAMDSFKTEPQQQGSRLTSLLVTDVTPQGAVEEYYGLKKGDQITAVGGQAGVMKIGEASNDDPEMAKMKVQEAFQGKSPIVVLRGGKKLTLPEPPGGQAVAAPAPGAPAAQPQQQPKPPGNVYDQVNNIKNSIPGQ